MKNFIIIKKKENIGILLILALAAFLRLFRLGHQSLWIDEINAVILAGKNIFIILFKGDTTPPFIYLVSHFWQKLGNSDFMVPLPSVLFGILSIWAAYKLAKVLLDRKEAIFTAFLISISLYHIMYSQEAARPYSAFILFSLLSLYYLYQAFNNNQRKYWAGLIIFNTLNLYTHNFSIFVLAEEIIIWTVFIFWSVFKKRYDYKLGINKMFKFCLAVIGILVLSLPISIQFLSAARSELAGGRVVLNPIYFKNLLCRYGAGNGLSFIIYNFFFISGFFSLFRGDKRKEISLLIFWLIFPFFILSFMELKHFFHIRYVIFTYPAYIIIISKGITNFAELKAFRNLKDKILALILIVFISLSLIPLWLYYQMPARLADWKGAAEYIYNNAKDGAKVITNAVHDNLIIYYLEKKAKPDKIEVITHHDNEYLFADMLSNSAGEELYYVTSGNDEIEYLATRYFRNKLVFFSPVYLELGKRELIDWDETSWFNISDNRYRLILYFNNKN